MRKNKFNEALSVALDTTRLEEAVANLWDEFYAKSNQASQASRI